MWKLKNLWKRDRGRIKEEDSKGDFTTFHYSMETYQQLNCCILLDILRCGEEIINDQLVDPALDDYNYEFAYNSSLKERTRKRKETDR